ncbi:NADH:ubiquinone reductase (H(+)-translocating) [Saliniradius amylolyticus]|uniref:Probable inorganic carbon transporter subunit DabB n=1 Tax=Saliniradius amylolyticus TaxID=2183582 RepID=A0A2S2E728_9ALTE|nr:NADH-quinone oxidoreductase subunit L [Saliniradius amylolyticus]AWL13454.1 NADH:ubiquinone reductase (H(+)-translocating) [Saliniradius amylolyticus]
MLATLANLVLCIPLAYLLWGWAVTHSVIPTLAHRWRITLIIAAGGLLIGACSVGIANWGVKSSTWVLLDALSLSMLLLITFIGLMILGFSRHYLDGEQRQDFFQRWFLLTLTSISTLVISNHLVVSFVAWVLTSLCLHKLLLFYPERPKAQLAAHKRFILSRFADISLFIAFVLIYLDTQSFKIDAILTTYVSRETLSISAESAMVLMVFAAILKCAQLPFHGWLLQVMEAPTPVSALLHAGIVNIGGFLMMRFADGFAMAPAAQWLLLVVGTLTALTASLIMMTRISIKVMLAWSTCAQMGFMLMEVALGLYELALLHLIAHSCYKAYNFLNAGETVNTQIAYELRSPRRQYRALLWLLVPVAVVGLSLTLAYLWLPLSFKLILVTIIVAFAISVFLAEAQRFISLTTLLPALLMGALTMAVYALWHNLFAVTTANLFPLHENGILETGFVLVAFALFYGLFASLRLWPDALLSRKLYPPLYAGLYLDEWFTRQTLKWWPIKFTDGTTSTVTTDPKKECC